MNTEDLFKYGVTPKEGKDAGKRFLVEGVKRDGILVYSEDLPQNIIKFENGTYDIWREPKTLFEDRKIESTWGNLKKAMEAAGLGDETKFAVHDFIIGFREAELRKEKLQDNHGHEKTYIIVE